MFVDGARSDFSGNASLSSLVALVYNTDSAVAHTDYDVSLLYRTTDDIYQLFLAEFEVRQLQPLAIDFIRLWLCVSRHSFKRRKFSYTHVAEYTYMYMFICLDVDGVS